MKRSRKTLSTVLFFTLLFLGAIVTESCASSKPGFNKTKSKGKKMRSSGKMY